MNHQYPDKTACKGESKRRCEALVNELKDMRRAGLEPVPEFFVLAEAFIEGTLSFEMFEHTLRMRAAPPGSSQVSFRPRLPINS